MTKKIVIIVGAVVVTIAILFGIYAIGYQFGKHNVLQDTTVETSTVETKIESKTESTVEIENAVSTNDETSGIIPTVNKKQICKNFTKYFNITASIDFCNWGEYDSTLPYEENHTNGIIYADDGVYVALDYIDTDCEITKTELWNYDGTTLSNQNLTFTAITEIKDIIHNNIPLGLKAKDHTCVAIKLNPTVEYKDYENPVEYNKEISVAIYYTDSNGENQIAWVQIDNIATYE